MNELYMDSSGRPGPAHRVDRVLPHNVEIEAIVLGMILDKTTEVAKDIERHGINSRSFYDLRHQAIYAAVRALLKDGLLPDVFSVLKRLGDEGNLEKAGGTAYVGTLPSMTGVLFEYYVQQLHDLSWRRHVIACTDILRNCAHDPTQPMDGVAADLERVLEVTRQKNAAGLTMRTPAEIMAMSFDDKDCYVGDRLIAAGQSTTIIGPGGIGKSRLLLQLAAACITGREFLGLPTRAQGKRWLIFQAENSNRRLRTDLEHVRNWIGEENCKAVDEHLIIHTLETEDDCFLSLEAPHTVTGMKAAIAKHEPDIIAVDPLYSFANGDLNSDSEMRKTLQTLSRIVKTDNPQRALVVLHHSLTGKAGVSRAVGFERSSYGRNSKVLHAWARTQINIAPGSGEDNNSLIVSCGKNNNGQEFKRFAVRLDNERMIYEVDGQFDWDAWQAALTDSKPVESIAAPARVRELCATPQPKLALAKAIMEETGCVRPSAYRFIKRAEESGEIRFNEADQVYLAC